MKLAIILSKSNVDYPGYRVVLRAEVPLDQQAYYAAVHGTSGSAYPLAEQEEIDALQAGEYVEKVEVVSSDSLIDVKRDAEDLQRKFQEQTTNSKKYTFYSLSWDGKDWE